MGSIHESDTLVIGGGVVGMSIGYGLARAGERVQVLDGNDDAIRSARGNFGLVRVQGKGLGNPDYARWSIAATQNWPAFAQELKELTEVDVELSQAGGFTFCLDDAELASCAKTLETIRQEVGGNYPFEMLNLKEIRELSPFVGPEVVGAAFSSIDGHANPLRLLHALVQGFKNKGGRLSSGVHVDDIEYRAGEFRVHAGNSEYVAGKLVLAAGLGNRHLAPKVGLTAPVEPNRGQLLVTERIQPFLRHSSLTVRQTGEGVVQIGVSHEDAGLDEGTTITQLSEIASRAVRYFPLLANVNVVRTWGALRVMSPDGFPIYQSSSACPGAFVASCHSGITLAAQHAGVIADWVRGGPKPTLINSFNAERFHV